MPGYVSLSLRLAAGAVLLLTAAAGSLHAQQKVGISSAVNPQATGTPPGRPARQLVIGQDVVFNEHIATAASGQTQLLFLDESSMTVGPNSDLTIDQFVYDPKTGAGRLAMSAARGLLRYVGGKLSKQPGAVTMRTSTATLAVRGGVFFVEVTQGGATEVIFVFGRGLVVTARNGVVQTLRRPGYKITVSSSGVPSAPEPASQAELAQLTGQLDGRRGGNGGNPVPPTNAMAANNPINNVFSDLDASIQETVQNSPPSHAPVPQPAPSPLNPSPTPIPTQAPIAPASHSVSAGQAIACISEGTCDPTKATQVGTVAGQPVGGPNSVTSTGTTTNGFTNTTATTGGTPAVRITYAGRLKNTNGRGTAQGFVDQSANGDIAYANGVLTYPSAAPQSGVFAGTFGSLGQISFPLPFCTGSGGGCAASFGPQGTSSSFGTFTGTSFMSADDTFFYAAITPTNAPGERLFIFGGIPVDPGFYQPTGAGLRPQTTSYQGFTPVPTTSNTRLFAFAVQPDAALQSTIPFIRSQAGGNLPNASVSPLYVVAPPTTLIGDASTLSAARALQASLAIDGQGANQRSAIAVTTGTFDTLQSSGRPILSGHLRGSSLLSASGAPVRLGSAVGSAVDGNGNSLYGGSGISGFVLDQTAHSAGTSTGTVGSAIIPSTASEVPLSGTTTPYGFAQAVLPAPVPAGVGQVRSTRSLSGNFGGLMYTTAQTTPYIATGGVFVSTDAPNNRIQATLAGAAQSPSSGVNTLTMQFGGLTGASGGREAFIDDNTFAVLESQTNPQQINGQALVVGGDPKQAGKLYLVSSGAAGVPSAILPNGLCQQCQYLKWGYWGGDLLTGNSSNSTISRIDRGHINTWVAGLATPLSDINSLISQSATATYTGQAIGSVFNNGQSYLAAGGFTGTYNFGTQTGAVAVSNFDGHSFGASGAAPLTGSNYTFAVNSPGTKGTIHGGFYGPMAAETGGNFAVQSTVGPAYLASGIFAGKR
jgi:trimeric autotransporter adhesin